ncbi:TonB-dependent receptor plug domain-containing protein [Phaeobacter marinintestinus]|uniref:TonB-dependent receptor plug domain-containing protein n=1 Tax=Falsiphaeobacter marinintestinus TaxID=1492905 RepID=UPI0011B6C2F8|nr:TonB-dependent receptor [Phaeobacter marinintestinus]
MNRMNRLLISASTLALTTAPAAFAEDIIWLDAITVSASKSGDPIELERTGATVEVLDQEQIERAPETTVIDTLSKLPGVSSSSNGGLGSSSTLRIRGLDGKYIKVLVDGIDVTDPSSTQIQYNFGGLTTTGITRLELLKGSSSSLYGSSAVAGVVSIGTSAQPVENGTQISGFVEGGTFDTWRGAATIASRSDRGGLSFTIGRVITDGFSSRAAGDEPDGYQATQLNFTADYAVTDVLTFGVAALALDSQGDFDEFGGDGTPPFDEYNTTETRAIRAYAELDLGAFDHTISGTFFKNDRVSSSNGFDTPFLGERRRFDYLGTYDPSDIVTYSFGFDWQNESYDSGADNGEVDTAGAFAEILYAPTTDLDLSGSLRLDDHENFGTHVTGRLAAAYRVSDQTILRAVAATGFRAPSLYELHNSFYGNQNLDPEESLSFELGAEHQFGGVGFVKATAFYTEIDNLIQFASLFDNMGNWIGGQYQQVTGTSVSKGIELSAQYDFSEEFSLYGNYTYTDAEDATGARLLRVPGHDVVVGLSTQFANGLTGDLNVQYIADRPDEFGTVMGDYTVVNAALNFAVTDTAAVYVRVENLFDETYETSAGYNASGRALFAGLRARF